MPKEIFSNEELRIIKLILEDYINRYEDEKLVCPKEVANALIKINQMLLT